MNQKNSFLVNRFKQITRKEHGKTYDFVSEYLGTLIQADDIPIHF
ncbi:hypothetical protein ACILPE_01860 [Capnocytophaga canimorsus]|nr:hypothetical protein [Capnocytophaga canimorsus]